jgi:hypothetical protein
VVGHSPCNIGKLVHVDCYALANTFGQETTLTLYITFLHRHPEVTQAAVAAIEGDFDWTFADDINDAPRDH